MSCFYHHERNSVGGCKCCGKGLCAECAVDLGKGLACRGRCEDDVRAVISLIDQNIKLSAETTRLLDSRRKLTDSSRKAGLGSAAFNLVTGSVFVAWGLTDRERFFFMIILGACFLAYGVFGLIQARRFTKDVPKD